jgi:class 3 adenylate cyclase
LVETSAPHRGGSAVERTRLRNQIIDRVRESLDPQAISEFTSFLFELDSGDVLSLVHAPTLVLHDTVDRWSSLENGHYLAHRITGASLVEISSSDPIGWGALQDGAATEISNYLAAIRGRMPMKRWLATIMITDIVRSTAQAARIGDEAWRELLGQHDALIERLARQFDGRILTATGDGFLVSFNSPTKAIRCATSVKSKVKSMGLTIRAGIHTGECIEQNGQLTGMTINIAVRIAEKARSDSVLISRTVMELAAGSGIYFASQGLAKLKGVPGKWELFSVNDTAKAVSEEGNRHPR